MSRKTRKLIWSVPLIAAAAVIGALAAFMTLGTGDLFADELADAPQNLSVEAADGMAGRTTLVLTWEAPASGAPDMYRIDRSNDNNKWKYLTSVAGNTLTHTDSTVGGKFDTGNTRYYRVLTMDSAHGAGAVSTSESATTDPITVPAQVKPFDASPNGPEATELTWTVPDDGGSAILGYCILAWPTNTTETVVDVDDANCKDMFFTNGPGGSAGYAVDSIGGVIRILPGTSYMHKGRRAKQEWSYEIYALNEHGFSQTASAIREAITDEADDPPKPGNLLVRQVASNVSGIIDLYWTVSGDGGQDIEAYRVEVSAMANQWPLEDTALPTEAEGDRTSDGALAERDTDADGGPTGPLVDVIHVGTGAADDGLSYDLRHTVGGLPAIDATDFPGKLYYRVRVETQAVDGTNRKMSAYTMGQVDLSGVDTDNPFEHTDKTPSAPVLGADGIDTTAEDPAPVPHTGMADNLTDDDEVPGEVTLTVLKSTEGGSDDYRVDISDDGGDTWTMVHSSTRPINQTEYEHQGLKPNMLRSFRIFTKKGSYYSVGSNVVNDYSAHSHEPGEVQNLTANSVGAGSINLTWSAPDDDGGAMIDKYCIIANNIDDDKDPIGTPIARANIAVTGPGANCTRFSLPDKASITLSANDIFNVAPSTTNVTFKGLDQETRWEFEVYGLNGATVPSAPPIDPDLLKGVAEESETEDAKTTEAVVPPAPVNLNAELARDTNFSGVGSRGVLVLWNAPSDPAGAPIVGYKIERSIDGGEFEEKVSSRDAGMTHWVDTSEPAAGEVRVYRVTSINAVGVGTMMASITIPLASHTHGPVSTALTAPTVVEATGGTGELTVTWVDGENAVGHLILLLDGADIEAMETAPTGNSHKFTDLSSGVYTAVVVSYKSVSDYLYAFDGDSVQ